MFKLAVCFVVFAHSGQYVVIMLFSVYSKIARRMPAIRDEIKLPSSNGLRCSLATSNLNAHRL